MNTAILQSRLKALGYDPGPLDGAMGPKTRKALVQFQVRESIPVTGVADPATIAVLFPQALVAKAATTPPWLEEALRLKGLREAAGPANNPTIIGWAKSLSAFPRFGWVGQFYTADSIAWCALFVSHCLRTVLHDEPLPANPLGALDYGKVGQDLSIPQLGAIMAFKRPGGGHVGFYLGERKSDGAFRILGGNQADSVSEAWIARDRLAATRWPKTFPVPPTGRVFLSDDGAALSSNEA